MSDTVKHAKKSKREKSFWSKIAGIDIYGTPISLKIDGDEQLKSVLGGLCTGVTGLIIVGMIVSFVLEAQARFGEIKVIWSI